MTDDAQAPAPGSSRNSLTVHAHWVDMVHYGNEVSGPPNPFPKITAHWLLYLAPHSLLWRCSKISGQSHTLTYMNLEKRRLRRWVLLLLIKFGRRESLLILGHFVCSAGITGAVLAWSRLQSFPQMVSQFQNGFHWVIYASFSHGRLGNLSSVLSCHFQLCTFFFQTITTTKRVLSFLNT